MPRSQVIPFANPALPACAAPAWPVLITLVGRDTELLRLRSTLLAFAGYTVESRTPDQAGAAVKKATYAQLWILCHTLEFYELAQLALTIKKSRPTDKLLLMSGLEDFNFNHALFDELFPPAKSVDDLLRSLSGLAERLPAHT